MPSPVEARRGAEGSSTSSLSNEPASAGSPTFLPVVALANSSIVGFEARAGEPADIGQLAPILTAAQTLPLTSWLDLELRTSLLRRPRQVSRVLAGAGRRSFVLQLPSQVSASSIARLRRMLADAGVRARISLPYQPGPLAAARRLHDLRPELIRLEPELIEGIGGDPVRQSLVTGLVQLAAGIPATVVAQGVRTPAERASLVSLGVELGQGPLLGKARPARHASRRARRINARRRELAPIVRPSAGPVGRHEIVQRVNAILWEADGTSETMTFVSEGATELTGHNIERWVHEPDFWERHLHPDDRDATRAAINEAVAAGRSINLEYRFRVADGSYRWFSDLIETIPGPNGHYRLFGVMIDVTERHQLEEELAHRASHDPLTDLLNRTGFHDALSRALLANQRGSTAVFFLDLDDFKVVNDSLGHRAGDELLRVIAGRLRASVRAGDAVARFGGDEFVVLARAATPDDLVELGQRLVEVVGAPSGVGGHTMRHPVSVGIAFAAPGEPAETVLRNADIAMYAAKQSGGAKVAVYRPEMHEAVLLRLEQQTVEAPET